MIFVILVHVAAISAVVGRWLMGRWFNHLSVYSVTWGTMLVLEQCQLIAYLPISGLTWFYIFAACGSLFLGSWMFLPMNHRWPKLSAMPERPTFMPRLRRIINLFSLVGIVALWTQLNYVMHEFGGSLSDAILVNANLLYNVRVGGESGGISYLGTFAAAGCALAGMYTAKIGKLTLAGILPLTIVVLSGILTMGRANMMFAIAWFTASFLLTPRPKFKLHKGISATLIVAVPLAGIGFVSSTRGLSEHFTDLSPTMARVVQVMPHAESSLFGFTAPVVGFSEYLKHPRGHNAFVGMYTFAPIFRGLSHLGLDTSVPRYEEFYPTPAEINVMTWLKNIHSDFGPLGIFFFPWLLGAALTWLKLRLDRQFKPIYVVLLAHGYLLVLFSVFYNPMLLGVWYLSLLLGTIGSLSVQRKSRPASIDRHRLA